MGKMHPGAPGYGPSLLQNMGETSVFLGTHETRVWQRGSHSRTFPVAPQTSWDLCRAAAHLERCRHIHQTLTPSWALAAETVLEPRAWLSMDKERGRRPGGPHKQCSWGGRSLCSSTTPSGWEHVPGSTVCKRCVTSAFQMGHKQTEAVAVHAPGQHKPTLLPNPRPHSHPCNTSLFRKVSASMVRHLSSPSSSFLAVQCQGSLLA